eukprot:CAMPEP_0172674496 /NCGR_PEP_ID=MMETSP1074-20121228/12766_1 /TAXON_ID=2916 /ORGANISM="Ceratium fusus, Strain PA161109" /LENGTH=904 /DNA_ID=CAMNT_0013491907 /DNA_START=141 /DNA_END=2858 /DNA_ORIENTATION=+
MAQSFFLILLLAAPAASATRLHIRHGSLRRANSSAQETAGVMKRGDPATLADYCSGEGSEPTLKDDQPVEADWENYGAYYPGKVSDVNKNGTVDIHYEDGWKEKRVKPDNVKIVDDKDKGKKRLDDAACEVVDKLEDVKKKVEETERDVKLYMTGKNAEKRGIERPKLPESRRRQSHRVKEQPAAAPAPAPWWQPPAGLIPVTSTNSSAPAPAPAPLPANASPTTSPIKSEPISKEKSKELEMLREELSGLDDRISKLREEIAINDRIINGEWEDEEDLDDDGVLSIDDLIQQCRDRIAERKEELEELEVRRRQQDAQLARVGAAPISLGHIWDHVKEILTDVADMKAERDKLEKEDKLDPELGLAMDDLIAEGEALDATVSGLAEAEKRAEKLKHAAEDARREAAKQRREARASAKKKAEELERRLMEEAQKDAAKAADAGRAMSEAFLNAKKKARRAEEEAIAQEEAALEQKWRDIAAQEAEAEAESEHALQAAMRLQNSLEVVKSGTQGMDTQVHPNGEKWWRYRYEHSFIEGILAILVSFLVMCWEGFIRSIRGCIFRASALKPVEVHAHQSLYQHWLDHFLNEMVACLLMFLTVWLLGHLGFFNHFPTYLKGHSELHLPTTGYQYKVLAYEMCVILTFALILYFCLAISVVHAATQKLAKWKNKERAIPSGGSGGMAKHLTLGGAIGQFNDLKLYFVEYVTLEDPEAIDVQGFSFYRYLLIAVRGTVDSMLIFGPLMWIAILWTFGVFLFIHAYAHVAFIRIMTFFLAVLVAALAAMMWAVVSVNRTSAESAKQFSESPDIPRTRKKHQSWIIFGLMTYAVFFLCYGTSRTLLQPWLWKLYFYALLFVAGFSLVMCLVFAFAIAPLIPTYGASVAMPPYVDVAHVKSLKVDLQDDQLRS